MGVNIQTIKDIRLYAARELGEIYHDPELIAITNLIIKTVFGFTKLHQFHLADNAITREQVLKIIDICKELKTSKPFQYILGESTFYDCLIKLNSSTLIPRPETEELVDLIIRENKGYQGDIIDFGTGSGCIAIALAANLQGAKITGIDISGEAISIARENAGLNSVNVSFVTGDIFSFDIDSVSKAGIIVSNPPYVRNSEKQLMNKNVLDFEPHTALFVDDSAPLIFYKEIINIAKKVLIRRGRLYFEINEAMGNSIAELLTSSGYSDIRVVADINNKDRIIKATKNG